MVLLFYCFIVARYTCRSLTRLGPLHVLAEFSAVSRINSVPLPFLNVKRIPYSETKNKPCRNRSVPLTEFRNVNRTNSAPYHFSCS